MAETPDDSATTADDWLSAGRKVALATVTRTWGSAPRPAGSQMAVRDDGAFVGSVSGGCVEGAVIEESRAALADGKTRNLKFGVADEDAWAVGLACGGTVEIHVAPAPRTALHALRQARDTGTAAVLASRIETGEARLLFPAQPSGDVAFDDAARQAARRDASGAFEIGGGHWFLTVFNPPLDLVLNGAVHIALPLARIARLAGYGVRVIDPRTSFATPERFPETTLVHDWPDEALRNTPLGRRSALVALTHDPKLDDPALAAALRSDCFYIGALGSKKTHARRLERLKEAGFSDADLARIHGPIGLDIGARSPAEIAISILAEMTQVLRKED